MRNMVRDLEDRREPVSCACGLSAEPVAACRRCRVLRDSGGQPVWLGAGTA